jgi:hypothetical protein
MISPIEVSPSSAPGQIKVIRVSQNARKQIVFNLTDDSGQSVDLKAEVENPPAPDADFTPQAAATGSNVGIRLLSASSVLTDNGRINLEGTILDQEEHRGFVEFTLPTQDTTRPGIYELYIERYIKGGEYTSDTWPVLLAIEPPAMALLDDCPIGPLLIPEVRLALYDLDNQTDGAPFSNLLDDTEFQDVDIVFAMRRAVQLWNETPPPVVRYTPNNFPYRYWWLQATCAELLIMSARRYRRNRLAYQAGGIAIDDQSKANEYEQVGRQVMQDFMEWMRTEKYRINMNVTWGTGI